MLRHRRASAAAANSGAFFFTYSFFYGEGICRRAIRLRECQSPSDFATPRLCRGAGDRAALGGCLSHLMPLDTLAEIERVLFRRFCYSFALYDGPLDARCGLLGQQLATAISPMLPQAASATSIPALFCWRGVYI